MGLLGRYEFKPTDAFFRKFAAWLCESGKISQKICTNVIFMICGYSEEQMDTVISFKCNFILTIKYYYYRNEVFIYIYRSYCRRFWLTFQLALVPNNSFTTLNCNIQVRTF